MTNLSGQFDGVQCGIDINSSTTNVEVNGRIDEGRIEVGPWSRESIAHADPQRSGWCC